ncbi:MAG: SBBP repeat-containing protein [Chloroflexota bacterium]
MITHTKRIRTFLYLITIAALLVACDPNTDNGTSTPTPGGSNNTNNTSISTITTDRWIVPGPTDPAAPKLIEHSANKSSRLTPGWKIDKIDYSDDWWGLGKPGLNNNTIQLDGSTYKKGGSSTVSEGDVQALVQSLDDLYPAQQLMQGHAWTDDYPSWTVELTGTDGQHVMLFASSTGNPGNGPWTVLYNGRLYAQYSGAVAKPLGALFGGRLGKDDNPFSHTPSTDSKFATTGLPRQLTFGFWGLLPISSGFSYTADTSRSEITGQIVGSSRIGSMEIGQIKELNNLTLTATRGDVTCKVELLPEGDPWTATTAWSFTCPVATPAATAKAGDHYSYPVKASFATDKGDKVDVSGELWGTWPIPDQGRSYPLLPPPPDIQDALMTNPGARDLLSDHILGVASYSAILPANDPMKGKRGGEAVLFGSTAIGSEVVRYTVDVQFTIEDGKVTYWDLDRSALYEMLKQITAYPLTDRVIKADPHAVINMWYASGAPEKVSAGLDNGTDAFTAQVNSCGAVPGGSFPSKDKPLMGFTYNSSVYYTDFGGPPFVIIDGKPVVSELTIYPASDDPAQKVLLPAALDTGASKPFSSVFMETTPYSGGGPTIRVRIPEKATPEESKVYGALLDALPVKAEAGEGQMIVRGVTLSVDNEGKLGVTSCSAQTGTETKTGSDTQPNTVRGATPPRIAYSTYYGSVKGNIDWITNFTDMTVDSEGYAYAVVTTDAPDVPLKNPMKVSSSQDRTIAAKFNQDGTDLIYATALPLGEQTGVRAIAVGPDGALYLTGHTIDESMVENTINMKNGSDPDDYGDAFMMKLSPDGSKVEYSVILGGTGYDEGYEVTVDSQGNAYMLGETRSDNFPTVNAKWPTFRGPKERGGESFIAKVSPHGEQLLYSTYFGGSGYDGIYSAATDAENNLYLTGYTGSTDFPTAGPAQPTPGGQDDAFLTKLSPDGSAVIFSTFLGGTSGDSGADIAFDHEGNIYVTGNTTSADFPLKNPLFSTFNGGVSFSSDEDSVRDAFVAKFNPGGSELLFSTYLGGSVDDRGRGIGLDSKGNIYVGGATTSVNFPLAAPLQDKYAGGDIGLAPDSFIAKLTPDLSAIVYSTYFGGQDFDDLMAFSVDKSGGVYFAGSAEAPTDDFPISANAFQTKNPGRRSIYLTKLTDDNP